LLVFKHPITKGKEERKKTQKGKHKKDWEKRKKKLNAYKIATNQPQLLDFIIKCKSATIEF